MGVRASDGELLWTYDIDKTTAVIPTPIIRDDLVFFSAGYGRGGALLKQVASGDAVNVEEIYPLNTKLTNKHGGIVLVGDHLYGDTNDKGTPFCAGFMTGKVLWKSRGSGKSSAAVTAADGKGRAPMVYRIAQCIADRPSATETTRASNQKAA